MEWNRKRGWETKILKREGKLGQGVSALKSGAGTPLQTMEYFVFTHLYYVFFIYPVIKQVIASFPFSI